MSDDQVAVPPPSPLVDALRDEHRQEADGNGVWCRADSQRWPCLVIHALDLLAEAEAREAALLTRQEALEAALERIDALPVGHYRKNGCASPDPWVRQREVHRIIRAALLDASQPVKP